MARLTLEKIKKIYGKTVAADIPYLEIKDKEFFGLLGPSGCGKTTTLRIIAGLTKPDEGRVLLDGKDITNVPPEKRNMAMVFQSWALFPHMTVYDNVAFGLRLRKVPENEIRKKVKWALELLRLEGLENRYPHQLSGGQQQRVAVARAIVIEPQVLLFDEPLSNLDAKLRENVRFELRKLQKRLGITSIYVTHDQAEAFAICDRIAIMNKGKIIQLGTPEEIYNKPVNLFVASFVGVTYFIEGRLTEILDPSIGKVLISTEDGLEILAYADLERVKKDQKVTLVVRPEYVHVASESNVENVFLAKVDRATYTGDGIDYEVKIGKWPIRLKTSTTYKFEPGSEIKVHLDPMKIIVLPEILSSE